MYFMAANNGVILVLYISVAFPHVYCQQVYIHHEVNSADANLYKTVLFMSFMSSRHTK